MMNARTTVSRRAMLQAAALAPTLLAATTAHAVSLIDLQGLGNAIDAAAGALGKLADSLAHAISLGDKGYNVVSARQTRSKLKEIDARLTDLAQTKQSALVQNVHDYVALGRMMLQATGEAQKSLQLKLESSWMPVVNGIREVLDQTKTLLDELRQDRSDFVLDDARGVLLNTLDAKIGLLDKLRFGSPPEGPDQINQLELVAGSFDLLRQRTIQALSQMSKYIEKLES